MDSNKMGRALKLREKVMSIMNSNNDTIIKELEETIERLAMQSQSTNMAKKPVKKFNESLLRY